MPQETKHVTILLNARLDKALAEACPELSRSRVQQLIEQGMVTFGDKKITDASHKAKLGDAYTITIPPVAPAIPQAEDIPLDIIFEDEHLLVINKPPGLTVHPAPGNHEGTLVNALLAHCAGSLSGIGGVARPGIVHRIDKDTSGLLVVAKHDEAHRHLSKQLAERTLSRTYLALVWGTPKIARGKIETHIGRHPTHRKKMAVLKTGGKHAVTHYKIVNGGQGSVVSVVECNLETGRTHQIRVHMAHLGHPIVGDQTYGKRSLGTGNRELTTFPRQALHAYRLKLIHPITQKTMEFEAPLPADMQSLIEGL